VAAEPRRTTPWLIVVAAVVLAGLLAYTLFAGWLPTKQRMTRLEAEMKDVYAREAALQTALAQHEQRSTSREQQLNALRTERDELARRVEDLERELAAARARRR
jgi:septal ring factor EnvC (AmiA/AmiB activator)